MPLPPPGGRPFFNRYIVLGDKKSLKETIEEAKSKSKCAILYSNPTKPKFNFISDDKVHHCTHVSEAKLFLFGFVLNVINAIFYISGSKQSVLCYNSVSYLYERTKRRFIRWSQFGPKWS